MVPSFHSARHTIALAPGNPQALNRYSYVLNNPLRYTDPTGMFSEDEIMQYLGVSTWDDVLAMFGEGGVMAGAWGFLEVLRQAELGTPISMWFDVGNGFNASQPNMMGMFSEQDGALVFSGAFLDWSGAGGTWTISGLSAVTASTMMPSTGQYQVGWSGGYISATNQYMHLRYDPRRIDQKDLQLALISTAGDIGISFVVVGAAHGNVPLVVAGGTLVVGKVGADIATVTKSYNQYQRGDITLAAMAVDVGLTVGGYTPLGIMFDVADISLLMAEGVMWSP